MKELGEAGEDDGGECSKYTTNMYEIVKEEVKILKSKI